MADTGTAEADQSVAQQSTPPDGVSLAGLGGDDGDSGLANEDLWLPLDAERLSAETIHGILAPYLADAVEQGLTEDVWREFAESLFTQLKLAMTQDSSSFLSVKAGHAMLWHDQEVDSEQVLKGYQPRPTFLQAKAGFANHPVRVFHGVPRDILSKEQIAGFGEEIRDRFFDREMVLVEVRSTRKFLGAPPPMYGSSPYVNCETWFFYDPTNKKPVFSALSETAFPVKNPNADVPLFLEKPVAP